MLTRRAWFTLLGSLAAALVNGGSLRAGLREYRLDCRVAVGRGVFRPEFIHRPILTQEAIDHFRQLGARKIGDTVKIRRPPRFHAHGSC